MGMLRATTGCAAPWLRASSRGLCSPADHRCRLRSTADRVLDAGQQHVLVADDLEEVGGERASSVLMSLLLRSAGLVVEPPLVVADAGCGGAQRKA